MVWGSWSKKVIAPPLRCRCRYWWRSLLAMPAIWMQVVWGTRSFFFCTVKGLKIDKRLNCGHLERSIFLFSSKIWVCQRKQWDFVDEFYYSVSSRGEEKRYCQHYQQSEVLLLVKWFYCRESGTWALLYFKWFWFLEKRRIATVTMS